MSEKPTFCIADVHGHYDRLQELLIEAGILDIYGKRSNWDVRVVQLGDLGHFGAHGEGPTADMFCYEAVYRDKWIDTVLWGNHDRGVYDKAHEFTGFTLPRPEVIHMMHLMMGNGTLQAATTAHGWLLTHAGVHSGFSRDLPTDVEAAAKVLNEKAETEDYEAIIDAVSPQRTKHPIEPWGGILWRDHSEFLGRRWPQLFGHTKDQNVRGEKDRYWCIDVGTPDNGRLAGIWLPSQKIVEINLKEVADGVVV